MKHDKGASQSLASCLSGLHGLESVSTEDIRLFTKSIQQQVLAEKIKGYQWSPSLLKSVLYFPDLQEPSPLEEVDRQALTKETPDLASAAPCDYLEGFGDVKFRPDEKDYWFLAKAVPRLHQNIYQEIAALAFILQEASNPDSTQIAHWFGRV